MVMIIDDWLTAGKWWSFDGEWWSLDDKQWLIHNGSSTLIIPWITLVYQTNPGHKPGENLVIARRRIIPEKVPSQILGISNQQNQHCLQNHRIQSRHHNFIKWNVMELWYLAWYLWWQNNLYVFVAFLNLIHTFFNNKICTNLDLYWSWILTFGFGTKINVSFKKMNMGNIHH